MKSFYDDNKNEFPELFSPQRKTFSVDYDSGSGEKTMINCRLVELFKSSLAVRFGLEFPPLNFPITKRGKLFSSRLHFIFHFPCYRKKGLKGKLSAGFV